MEIERTESTAAILADQGEQLYNALTGIHNELGRHNDLLELQTLIEAANLSATWHGKFNRHQDSLTAAIDKALTILLGEPS